MCCVFLTPELSSYLRTRLSGIGSAGLGTEGTKQQDLGHLGGGGWKVGCGGVKEAQMELWDDLCYQDQTDLCQLLESSRQRECRECPISLGSPSPGPHSSSCFWLPE